MGLSAALLLVFTLVSACEAYSISFPTSQARRSVWQGTRILKRFRPARHYLQPVRQANPWPMQPLFHPYQGSRQDLRPKATARDVKLTNHHDKFYSCPITIGTPEQEFNVAFDISSSITWVPSMHSPPAYRRMHVYKRFNDELSSTHSTNYTHFDVNYDLARAIGYRSQDSVTIAGLMITNQSFGEALLEPDLFRGMMIDGILGLGLNNIDEEEEPSVFDNMVSQGLVPAPVFSIYLNRYGSGSPDSVLTLGGANPEYCEENFTFADVTEHHRWQFEIDKVQLSSGDGIFTSGRQAVIDSRTSFIVGPMREVHVLNTQLGGKLFPGHPGLLSNSYVYKYKFDCSEVDDLPDVEFIVNGKKLSLSSRDYVVKTEEKGKSVCVSGIFGMKLKEKDEPDWSLGLNFMRAYYTQFDKGNRRIGFARALSFPQT
ncbi:cathepsin d-like aspartic protease [Plakobranchus ocellatus]|uniref:Cathepsin d-like aspartic protease n=1 Tax=Plakobranchus ocellatus TaxID=259542 RepID=A0AAV3YQC2_9GAST|nr:cathepsin d-like aspartic protease [Plakobranchus ocellatus]